MINISAYKFTPLNDLAALRQRLLEVSAAAELKGTILLSPEGINFCVAGTRANTDLLLDEIRTVPGLEILPTKESESADQPFNRMLVKIKREIIAFGIDGIDPARQPTRKITATTLKQWLDEGRPVTLLDARNDYEIRMGTFRGAMPARTRHFREFPDAVRKMPEAMKDQVVVTFCTGGIRCEKAGPFLEQAGFKNVLQLDGGILRYFEECGGAHYEGECFVFDRRVGVDPHLRETNSVLCFNCQTPLKEEEQRDPRYVPDVSCPHCFGSLETGALGAAERDLRSR